MKDRRIVTADRKTKQDKEQQAGAEAQQLKDQALFKATLKKKDSGSDWEDVEEDLPHMRLEELLDNLKIDDPNEHDSEEEESKI